MQTQPTRGLVSPLASTNVGAAFSQVLSAVTAGTTDFSPLQQLRELQNSSEFAERHREICASFALLKQPIGNFTVLRSSIISIAKLAAATHPLPSIYNSLLVTPTSPSSDLGAVSRRLSKKISRLR